VTNTAIDLLHEKTNILKKIGLLRTHWWRKRFAIKHLITGYQTFEN